MQNLTIVIQKCSEEEGFFYEIYDCAPEDIDDTLSLDGGLCTTTLANALEMAYEQAKTIIK